MIWKTIVPLLAILVAAFAVQFEPGNFSTGGGFMPHGFHGVFAALTGGVVFALQGFEQAVQLAGEAKDPKRDLSRAILTAMAIGAAIYLALQIVLIGALEPSAVAKDWSNPLGDVSDYGAWYTVALALGIGWLAKVLLIDAVISPAGTGIVYVGTTARLSYALGEEAEMPSALTKTNRVGAPWFSIHSGSVIGCVALGPFPSWSALVGAVTGATAVMYAIAPVALAALQRSDPNRPRSYRVPMPGFVLPSVRFSQPDHLLGWLQDDRHDRGLDASGHGDLRHRSKDEAHRRHGDRSGSPLDRAVDVGTPCDRLGFLRRLGPRHLADVGRHRGRDRVLARDLQDGDGRAVATFRS